MRTLATNYLKTLAIIALMAFISLTGCDFNNSNNNPGNEAPQISPEALTNTSTCPNINPPCSSITTGEVITCKLKTTTCGVNLDDMIQQVGNGVTNDSIMWIQAWGGNGGSTDKGRGGGAGGYTQTTTTVNDIKGMFNGSAQLYFYLAHQGSNGDNHCGSTGGASTIITFEDLTLNLNNGPVPASPPTLLVAAGGGCGCNGNFGCFTPGCPANGGNGGVAIAGLSLYGEGTGGQYANGMSGQQGIGGGSHCVECGSGNEKPGLAGFGGRGGGGGTADATNLTAPGADFTGAYLAFADFSGSAANLQSTNWSSAMALGVDFSQADMLINTSGGVNSGTNTTFNGAYLQGALFDQTNLDAVNFTNTYRDVLGSGSNLNLLIPKQNLEFIG